MTQPGEGGSSRSREWRRRRYLAEVFGEILPETTSDDREAGSVEPDTTDTWYRSNRPPHHGAG